MLPEFLDDSPLLRQFFMERRFRIAIAGFIVLVVALVLFLPKWWTISPPNFIPTVKASGLDRVQSWSLRRAAARHARENHLEEAIHAWRMAILNDSCDLRNSYGPLELLIQTEPPAKNYMRFGVSQAIWMLRLTQTNDEALVLSTRFFAHYGLDEFVLHFLQPRANHLPPSLASELLQSLFRVREMDRFDAVWSAHPSLHTNATLMLYRAAWLAGWGPPGGIREARATLGQAKVSADPATRILAHRLHMAVDVAVNDLESYGASLKVLEAEHVDAVPDHVDYLRLLAGAGKKDEATRLLKVMPRTPSTAKECAMVADIYVLVGLRAEAVQFLKTHLEVFPDRLELWMRQADLLTELANWTGLRELAVELRQVDALRDAVSGYAWFLEGLAELRRDRKEPAERAFDNMMVAPIVEPLLGYRAATGVAQLGHPEMAQRLLERFENTYSNRVEYWYQVELAAYRTGDIEGMLAAAEKAYALEPNAAVIVNNYAAALLMMRQRPAEAAKLTLRRLTEAPNDISARLNHCLALIQNKRFREAHALLEDFDPDRLQGLYATAFRLAEFEIALEEGQRSKALEAAKKVEVRFLKPPQVRWFEEARRRARDLPG